MKKLLIIEDEIELAKVLEEKFSDEDFEVKLAFDGESALPEAKKFHPDIILLDILLPKKDGFIVIQEFKADPNLKNIPVIFLSNLGEDEEIKKGLALGAVDYYVKVQHPINEIVEKVKNYALKGK